MKKKFLSPLSSQKEWNKYTTESFEGVWDELTLEFHRMLGGRFGAFHGYDVMKASMILDRAKEKIINLLKKEGQVHVDEIKVEMQEKEQNTYEFIEEFNKRTDGPKMRSIDVVHAYKAKK